MLWIIPLHCVNICHCDWFTKGADWLIAEQDKVRQDSQTRKMVAGRRAESGVAIQMQRVQGMNVPG